MYQGIKNFLHHHYHTRYHGIYNHARQLFVFDLCLLGLTIVLLGTNLWLFLWKPGLTNLIDLTLSVGTERIRSGDQVHLAVHYTNRSKFALRDAVIALRLPTGFIIDRTSTPETIFSSQNTFSPIPNIPAGGSGDLGVDGALWTEPKKEEKVLVLLSYQPEDSTTREQKIGSLLLRLAESVLNLSITTASSTFTHSTLPVTLTLTNNGSASIPAIKLSGSWNSVAIQNLKPETISLNAHSSTTLNLMLFTPRAPGVYPLTFLAAIQLPTATIPQATVKQGVTLIAPNVSVEATFVNPPRYVEPGGLLPISFHWENRGTIPLSNLRLHLHTTPGVVDIAGTAKREHFIQDGNDLIIDQNNRTALASALPHNADSFTINLKLLPHFALQSETDNSLALNPTIEGRVAALREQTFSEPGATIQLPLATELSLVAEPRYFSDEGDQLGRGPLPPHVGETTKYWIAATMVNTVNAVQDVTFSTTLLPGVNFTGRQSVTIGPPLTFDQTTRAIRWQFRELPAHSRTGLYFEVATTPTPNDVGKTIQLTKDLTVTASDEVVGKNFLLTIPGLTNTLSTTDRGSARGARVIVP